MSKNKIANLIKYALRASQKQYRQTPRTAAQKATNAVTAILPRYKEHHQKLTIFPDSNCHIGKRQLKHQTRNET